MISYYDGQLADILPSILKEDPAVQALSHALRQGTRLLYRYSQRLYLYSGIDGQPEEVLDLLAAELRTQYYREDMDIGTKRQLVKNTIIWYMSAGTPEAVEELAANVFGGGKVEEWFQYGGKPYCFRISTDAHMDEARMSEFYGMIARVKNTRSHLDAVEFERNLVQELYSCGVCVAECRAEVGYNAEALAYRGGLAQSLYSGGVCTAECRAGIVQGTHFYRFEVREDAHLWVLTDAGGGSAGFRISESGHLMADTDVVPDAGMYRIREDGHMVYGGTVREQDNTGWEDTGGDSDGIIQ